MKKTKGIRKIIKAKLGTREQPIRARIQDDTLTGRSLRVKSINIDVGPNAGTYSKDFLVTEDITLMGGGVSVGTRNDGDIVALRVEVGTTYADNLVDNIRLDGHEQGVYYETFGSFKIGGGLISAGSTIRAIYNRQKDGEEFGFSPTIEFTK